MNDTSFKTRNTRSTNKQVPTRTVAKSAASPWNFDDSPLKQALDTWQAIPTNKSLTSKESLTAPSNNSGLEMGNTLDVKNLLENIKRKLSEFS